MFACRYCIARVRFEISRFLEGAPTTEEPRPDASNAGRQRPATRAIGVSRALACVLKHPWLSTGVCFTLPRSSILCGCINFPDKQVNAVWGRCPNRMCNICEKSLDFIGALRQNLSRLRVEKLGCVCRQSSDHSGCLALPGS
jgi:hypothetical protein